MPDYTCPTHGQVEPVWGWNVTDREVGYSNTWLPCDPPECPECGPVVGQELEVVDEKSDS